MRLLNLRFDLLLIFDQLLEVSKQHEKIKIKS